MCQAGCATATLKSAPPRSKPKSTQGRTTKEKAPPGKGAEPKAFTQSLKRAEKTIGIPLGVASFKMAGAALVPFGKQIVRLDELPGPPEDAIVVGG